ncbi:hypothetical protein [Streptosporangium vulgare]|uniref:DUF998 domain-containing protein n=1 Tax=Streptosporangium vulgare TaxID=46190 RepID=A0ABV5TRN5_9ACTN
MRFVGTTRFASAAIVAGSLRHIASCVRAIADPTTPRSAAFAHANNLGSIAHILWLAGLLALAAAWAVDGAIARIGSIIATAALVTLVTAELIIGFSYDISENLFTVSVPLSGIGLTCLGAAVLRARTGTVWTGRATLATGLYVFAVMVPAFAVFGAPNYPALIGWGVTWLLLGSATWTNPAVNTATKAPNHHYEKETS